ncbi:uncharacterized protein K452DRAFT_75290 [Aplosporella prunicola CBS 121167]|uniref:DUF1765-domain-containing protein n=1 Tax=Aplosporella prunicola CBS 121167 TaxID=1176127 RepID=A0A6A6B7Z3_9PEZI|nr:uncharacterized protein K452DRAFT_75290 [Aplosporella prunicola CBS 121167]KAF2139324.1 hypothetical protein K452DRAFT_75290 [Aplosporella prunicola CBS 121167]
MHHSAMATIHDDIALAGGLGGDRSVSDETSAATRDDPRVPEAAYLPRSASYTYLPQVKDISYEDPSRVELKGRISEAELRATDTGAEDGASYASSGDSTPESEQGNTAEAARLKPSSPPPQTRRLSLSRFRSTSSRNTKAEAAQTKNKEAKETTPTIAEASTPKRSLTQLRRKSWVPSSQNFSPTKVQEEGDVNAPRPSPEKRRSFISTARRKSILVRKDSDTPAAEGDKTPDSPKVSRKGTVLTKRPRKPSNAHLKELDPEDLSPTTSQSLPTSPTLPPIPRVSSIPSIGKSFSTDRLPSLVRSPPSSDSIPPLPQLQISSERLKTFTMEAPRKKDELWNTFRSLDSDYQKFQSKSISLKANVVRSSLMPFLRTYAEHPSNNKLRPEDLDRRVNILSKWWTGLLEMVHGKNNQSISGTDRPAIFDGIVGIMERPEWRLYPSPFCPLAHRQATALAPRSNSPTSASSSSESEFLTESVYHNVRNIFVQNLTAQMTFVVDKMSLRSIQATLVSFSGKTCAYAFFFCPGFAEILIRLWTPSLDSMRRVMDECKVPRQAKAKLEESAKRLVPAFPPHLHPMAFTDPLKIFRELRKPAAFPLGTASLPWHGAWVKRWKGTESDLFYVFAKYFHVLAAEFLPDDTPAIDRLCVPGLVMVHAQILSNLDDTLHRHVAMAHQPTPPPPQPEADPHSPAAITFDDVLDPDASASAIPIPPANATRLMAENRLIMLLRDFLSARNSHLVLAPHMFAEAFSHVLQAGARRVKMFDYTSHYTLCDFLEEALGLMLRYEHAEDKDFLDWSFWITVFKRMANCHHNMTEMRLYSLLYSIWGTVVEDSIRKAQLCLEFLLDPEFFESKFNHWCPMVRAYYMRLLCWRIARFDGENREHDLAIFARFEGCLQRVWSHFLYLQETAHAKNAVLPSTAPCNPAPGRRFLIMRTDAPLSPTNGPFLSFDGIISNPSNDKSKPASQIQDSDMRPASSLSIASDGSDLEQEDTGKRRWSVLRNLISFPKSRSKSRSPGPPSNRQEEKDATSPNGTDIPDEPEKEKTKETIVTPPHRSYCFRFSLEYVDKRFQSPGNLRLMQPRLPAPAQIFLHSPDKPDAAIGDEDMPIALPKVTSAKPEGAAATSSKYAGRALGEWQIVVGECQSFFDRRKNEGVPNNKCVETPTLGVEVFRRPG